MQKTNSQLLMKQTLAVLILMLGVISGVYAQEADTTKVKISYSKFVIPTAMIFYGAITQGSKSLKELDHSTNHEISEHLKVTIPIDDYSQYAPAIAVYALDLMGINAKHNFRDRTIIMATSYIIMGATVQTMKSTINIERPDGSNNKYYFWR